MKYYTWHIHHLAVRFNLFTLQSTQQLYLPKHSTLVWLFGGQYETSAWVNVLAIKYLNSTKFMTAYCVCMEDLSGRSQTIHCEIQ